MDPKDYTYLCPRTSETKKNLQHLHPTLLESLGNFMKQNTIQHSFSRVKTDNYLTTNTSEVWGKGKVTKSTRNEIETSKFMKIQEFLQIFHFTSFHFLAIMPCCQTSKMIYLGFHFHNRFSGEELGWAYGDHIWGIVGPQLFWRKL